jgi:hypothetical protein
MDEPTVEETPTQETRPVLRNPDGTLKKGSKLGRGRKKGSKNKATLLREKMENKVSIKISKATPKIVDKVVEQAIDGDTTSQKMILDRAVPIKKAEDGHEGRDARVEIVITSMTRESLEAQRVEVLEGEYERVE